jgi:hypothetical protein
MTANQEELRATLRAIGIKRHGDKWKIRMAEDMRCSRSLITLWDNGERNIKGFAAEKLLRMAKLSGIKKSDIEAQILVD